jgi:hypothetical protein
MMLRLLLVMSFSAMVFGRIFITSYNMTHDPRYNNTTFKMSTGYTDVKDFTYVLDIWNKRHIDSQSSKILYSCTIPIVD